MKTMTRPPALSLAAILAVGCAGADGVDDGISETRFDDGTAEVDLGEGTTEMELDDDGVQMALESLPETLLTEDASHTQEELDAYRALLEENGGPPLIEKVGGSCGSRAGFWNQVATSLVNPDHFPPDSIASLPIAVPTALCLPFGVAHFHDVGCNTHDRCYSTPGSTREGCDRAFRRNLVNECDDVYGFFLAEPCRLACRGVAELMYEAVDTFGAGAFNEAQKNPISRSPRRGPPDPVCVAQCEEDCVFFPSDQIGLCQTGCQDRCR